MEFSVAKQLSVKYIVFISLGLSICMTLEVEGIRQRRCPEKTWWDCVKDDMESLGLSQTDAQFRNKWRRRIKGATG